MSRGNQNPGVTWEEHCQFFRRLIKGASGACVQEWTRVCSYCSAAPPKLTLPEAVALTHWTVKVCPAEAALKVMV